MLYTHASFTHVRIYRRRRPRALPPIIFQNRNDRTANKAYGFPRLKNDRLQADTYLIINGRPRLLNAKQVKH